ncbi:MAG: hypothetical protein VYB44_03250 [Bacteroidota bacterium]|nr:hypothetical protein [Bacteroidota bacterium]
MEAIIYMPGLGSSFTDQSLASFAHRYVKAVDINEPNEKKKYSIKIREESFGIDGGLKAQVAAVHEQLGQESRHVIDIYEFSYIDELTASFKKTSLIHKTFVLSAILFLNVPKVFYYTLRRIVKRRGGISEGSSGQFLYAASILALLASFGLLLVASFPVAIGDMVDLKALPQFNDFIENNRLGQFIDSVYGVMRGKAEYLIGFFALFYLVMPDFKLFITEMATELVCMIRYFSTGHNRLNLTGKFEELLEKVAEEDKNYDQVTVMAYSFGTMVALDTLFPMKGATSFRVADKVTHLVTIGCPFDFVRLYWKSYYQEREFKSTTLRHWYNIYSQADILSSNFRKDHQEGEAEQSVTAEALLPQNLPFNVLPKKRFNLLGFIMLSGIRAHGMYWEDQLNSASCLTTLVARRMEHEAAAI